MKKNAAAAMDRLGIDNGIRDLVMQLWKHEYRTDSSCEGNGQRPYILLRGGDGWLDENKSTYGLEKIENHDCCPREFEEDVRSHGLDPADFEDTRKVCGTCGAGVNGYIVYRGEIDPTTLNRVMQYLEKCASFSRQTQNG